MSSKTVLDELNELMRYCDPSNKCEKVLKAFALKLDHKFAKIETRLKQLEKGIKRMETIQ